MIEEIDIWRSANLLVHRHGEEAAAAASARVVELKAMGNAAGRAVWKRIHRAVIELQRETDERPPH